MSEESKDIEFRLNTTADTSGAEQASDALKNTGEAATKAQRGASEAAELTKEQAEILAQAARKAAEDSQKAGDDAEKAARRMEFELGKVRNELGLVETSADSATRGFEGMLDAGAKIGEISPSLQKEREALRGITEDAEAAQSALNGVWTAAQKAQAELDVVEANRRKSERDAKDSGGLFGIDLTGGVDGGSAEKLAASLGFSKAVEAGKAAAKTLGVEVNPAIAADAAAIGASFAAIGVAAVKSYGFLSDTVGGYKQLFAEAKAAGLEVGDDLIQQVDALEATLSPISGTIDFVKGKLSGLWDVIKDPAGELSGINDLKESWARQIEAEKRNLQSQLDNASEKQARIKPIYDGELESLKEQERVLIRMAGLRNQLAGLAAEGARQEIEDARMRGGDVALAEANALALQLKTGLAGLGDNLRDAQAEAKTADGEYNRAFGLYNQALRDGLKGLNPAEFQRLSGNVDAARKMLNDANQTVADQQQIFQESKTNLLRGAEIQLNKLEAEYSGKVSSDAASAFDGIYETLKQEVAKGPQAAISNISAAVEPVTAAATQKASEFAANVESAAADVSAKGDAMTSKIQQFAGAQEKMIGGLEKQIDAILLNTQQVIQAISARDTVIARQNSEINAINQRIQHLASGY